MEKDDARNVTRGKTIPQSLRDSSRNNRGAKSRKGEVVMKKIMTKERFEGLKGEEEYRRVVAECYQEVLNFVTEAIGTTFGADEPLLAAALEAFARTLKENMRDTELEIYEEIRKLGVTGFGVTKKTEE